jgi:hypothetical protein
MSTPEKMNIIELQSYIESIEKNASLKEAKKLEQRLEIIDFIEFHVLYLIEDLMVNAIQSITLISLKDRAEKIKAELEEINRRLFERLRTQIQLATDKRKEFKALVDHYIDYDIYDCVNHREIAYDHLDILINGLCHFLTMPEQTKDLEPEMVYYQKTPVRIVLELVEKSQYQKGDFFVDLGSGLGQVAILVNLLTGIPCKGIEYEPSFCDFANICAKGLSLSNVTFVETDARKADYSEGTIFFMFTPFRGEIMEKVLKLLKIQSLFRKIKIITYGPCTSQVALQDWLHFAIPKHNDMYQLGIFTSSKL